MIIRQANIELVKKLNGFVPAMIIHYLIREQIRYNDDESLREKLLEDMMCISVDNVYYTRLSSRIVEDLFSPVGRNTINPILTTICSSGLVWHHKKNNKNFYRPNIKHPYLREVYGANKDMLSLCRIEDMEIDTHTGKPHIVYIYKAIADISGSWNIAAMISIMHYMEMSIIKNRYTDDKGILITPDTLSSIFPWGIDIQQMWRKKMVLPGVVVPVKGVKNVFVLNREHYYIKGIFNKENISISSTYDKKAHKEVITSNTNEKITESKESDFGKIVTNFPNFGKIVTNSENHFGKIVTNFWYNSDKLYNKEPNYFQIGSVKVVAEPKNFFSKIFISEKKSRTFLPAKEFEEFSEKFFLEFSKEKQTLENLKNHFVAMNIKNFYFERMREKYSLCGDQTVFDMALQDPPKFLQDMEAFVFDNFEACIPYEVLCALAEMSPTVGRSRKYQLLRKVTSLKLFLWRLFERQPASVQCIHMRNMLRMFQNTDTRSPGALFVAFLHRVLFTPTDVSGEYGITCPTGAGLLECKSFCKGYISLFPMQIPCAINHMLSSSGKPLELRELTYSKIAHIAKLQRIRL